MCRYCDGSFECEDTLVKGLSEELETILQVLEKYPRVWKLMAEGREFVVVSPDEPCYESVSGLLQMLEMTKGQWKTVDSEGSEHV